MIIQLPSRLNGLTFYNEVLPEIYKYMLHGQTQLDFDMTNTQLANPEGLVNLLTACALIKNRYKYIPYIEIPESENLLLYLDLCNFFSIAQVPNSEVLRFKKTHFFKNEKIRYYVPHINNITPLNSSISSHQTNVSKIFRYIQNELPSDEDIRVLIDGRYKTSFELAGESIDQLIRNVIEHNMVDKSFVSTGYYMMQKMPYDVLEIVCSDIGKGIRSRILEMIEDGSDLIKDESGKMIHFYKPMSTLLKDNTYLFKDHKNNPNFVAINLAIKFRENSNIPGLAFIKKFVISKNGSISIHTGNCMVIFDSRGSQAFFYDSHFTGCHIKIDIPINK